MWPMFCFYEPWYSFPQELNGERHLLVSLTRNQDWALRIVSGDVFGIQFCIQGSCNNSARGHLFKMKESGRHILLFHHIHPWVIFILTFHMHHKIEPSLPSKHLSNHLFHTINTPSTVVLILHIFISHPSTVMPSSQVSLPTALLSPSLHSNTAAGVSDPQACRCDCDKPYWKFFSGSY